MKSSQASFALLGALVLSRVAVAPPVTISAQKGWVSACRLAVAQRVERSAPSTRRAWVAKPLSIEAILREARIPAAHLRAFRDLWRTSLTLGEHYETMQLALDELEAAGEAERLALCVLEGPCPLAGETAVRWHPTSSRNAGSLEVLATTMPELTPLEAGAWITKFWQVAYGLALENLLARWRETATDDDLFAEARDPQVASRLFHMLLIVGRQDIAEAVFLSFQPDFRFTGRSGPYVQQARQAMQTQWSGDDIEAFFPRGRHLFDRVGEIVSALRAVVARPTQNR